MMQINSINNELVKETVKLQQKKYRTSTKKFIIEGEKSIQEAIDSGIELEYIFINKDKPIKFSIQNNTKIVAVTEHILKKISTTETPPSSLAIGFQKEYDKKKLLSMSKVILLEDIRDLGNLGTIIRSSVSFCADAIIIFGDSVDIYNPKCVRSCVGNLWKIPVYNIKSIEELSIYFSKFRKIATLPTSSNLLKSFKPTFPMLLMFGSEANGLSEQLINFSQESVKIEMNKKVESLNLAVSASIIMHHLFI